MKLHEIADNAPILVAVIDRYLETGRKIYWGSGKTINHITTGSTGFTLHFNYFKPATPKQTYGIQYSAIDAWELVPYQDGFRLKTVGSATPMREGVDDDAPMLVRLAAQRIAKGEEVGINLHVGSAGRVGGMRFPHVGDIISIELKHGVSKDVQRLIGGHENGVFIVYRKRHQPSTIVLDTTTFDDLYVLKPFDPANKEYGWVLADAEEEGKRHYAID